MTLPNIHSMLLVLFDALWKNLELAKDIPKEALALLLVKILSSLPFILYALVTNLSKTLKKVLGKPQTVPKTSIALLIKLNSTLLLCSMDLKQWEKDWVLLNFITTGLFLTLTANKTYYMTLQYWNWSRIKLSRRKTF